MLWALAAAAAVLFSAPGPPAQPQAASIQILASPGIEAPMDVNHAQLAMPLV